MVIYRRAEAAELEVYDEIPMLVQVEGELLSVDGRLVETPVEPYNKDLGKYERIAELAGRFDLSHWAFFLAFDGQLPIGGAAVASRTEGVAMLEGRKDLAVLWDIRVRPGYQGQGVGSRLFSLAADWAREQGLVQMKIESQNNNIAAARFYAGKGATLFTIHPEAYRDMPELRHEMQFLWYMDL